VGDYIRSNLPYSGGASNEAKGGQMKKASSLLRSIRARSASSLLRSVVGNFAGCNGGGGAQVGLHLAPPVLPYPFTIKSLKAIMFHLKGIQTPKEAIVVPPFQFNYHSRKVSRCPDS
jgi:hypothetical protein